MGVTALRLMTGVGDAGLDQLGVHKVRSLFQQRGQLKGHLFQRGLLGFQLAHIQHVVDQRLQVAGGKLDLLQAIVHTGFIVPVAADDVQHAHNAVDGRAHIMAHAVQEFGLGFALEVSLLISGLQAAVLLLIFFVEGRGIFQQCDAVDDRPLVAQLAVVDGVLRHQHRFLQPNMPAVSGGLLVFDGHLPFAVAVAFQHLG